jgi:hypothetical protein
MLCLFFLQDAFVGGIIEVVTLVMLEDNVLHFA